jgi:hypothetical protein
LAAFENEVRSLRAPLDWLHAVDDAPLSSAADGGETGNGRGFDRSPGPQVDPVEQLDADRGGLQASEAELMTTVFPHATTSEAMQEAALAAQGYAIDI